MIDMNPALSQNKGVNLSAINFRQNQKEQTQNAESEVTEKYAKLPLSYKGVALMDNKDVIVKIGSVNLKAYEPMGKIAVEDIKSRAGQKGQFLNWIDVLPKNQIQNLDELYALANKAKEDEYTDLAVLGIGGSRHTNEAMMKMIGKDANIHFYSGIDPVSFERFAAGLNLDKTKFLVVSKSGGTLETTVAYKHAKELMQKHLNKEDVSDRFIAMTDHSSEKSKLRQLVDKGEFLGSGFVHDDVGGRFSIFDDATIFTLAYAGLSKEDTKKMLEASLKAQKEFLNPDINQNEALQLAAFNVNAKNKGCNKHFVEYFGDAFAGTTLWEKQLKNESLKANISTDTNVGPGYLHYNAESDLDPNNKDSFYTFVFVKPQDKYTNALLSGAMTAYSAQHPVSKIELKDLSPESIARLIELKHFETLYTGNMIRQEKGIKEDMTKPLPEVVQPNVEIYKKEVKKVLEQ